MLTREKAIVDLMKAEAAGLAVFFKEECDADFIVDTILEKAQVAIFKESRQELIDFLNNIKNARNCKSNIR